MNKKLAYYYVIALWGIAFASIFMIIKPMLLSWSERNSSGILSNLPDTHQGIEDPEASIPQTSSSENDNNDSINTENFSDLIFYSKTAFMRYFRDKYPDEELSQNYKNAVPNTIEFKGKTLIRVVRKRGVKIEKKSFSESFDIKPVPVPGNNN